MMCVRVGCQRWGSSRRQAAVPAGGVGACPDNEPTRQATRQHTRSHRCEGRRRAVRGLAAVPVGGGGAWPGFEATRRAKLAARTARGRAAAHGHTKRSGPTARPDGARNTHGDTQQHHQSGGPPPTGASSSPAHTHKQRQKHPRDHKHTRARAHTHPGITKPPGPNGAGRQWR